MNPSHSSPDRLLEEKSVFDVKDIHKNKKIKQRVLFCAIVLAVVALVALVLVRTLCKVGTLTLDPTALYDPQQILEVSGIRAGDNLFGFSSADVQQRLQNAFPYLRRIRIQRTLPGQVHLSFQEELGSVCVKLGQDYYPLDSQQIVLKQCGSAQDGGSHRITVVSDRIRRCVVGEKIQYSDTTLFDMVDAICRAVEDNGVLEKIDTIDLTDKFDVTMDYDGRFTVFLGNTENLKYKIAMVMKVVEELYQDDTGEIDVRQTSTAYVKLYNK